MNIIVLGAGTQGTLYAVRLAQCGHAITLVARGKRAAELRDRGAIIQHAISGLREVMQLDIVEELSPDMRADLCFVTVRREQIDTVLPPLGAATGIRRIVFMTNHANGSESLFVALGKSRVVLGFPGAAGSIDDGVARYLMVSEQCTVIERTAPDIARMLRRGGFKVKLVTEMDSWLRRHAVFVTAVSGALLEVGGNAVRLAADKTRVRALICAVREGWFALDERGIAAAPLALRVIIQWVPLSFSVLYWQHLLGSPRGEYYFARHTRSAPEEMFALVLDVNALLPSHGLPQLRQLYKAIERATASTQTIIDRRSRRLLSAPPQKPSSDA